MLWTKLINILTASSCSEQQFDLSSLNNSVVKMDEGSHILTCDEVEEFFYTENFDNNSKWFITHMTDDDYENPLYDILEEDEEDITDEDIEYAEYATDFDY